ncbi:MAG: hypothetical protein R3A13_06980 [Bdellovibrionota bacterium]
MQSKPQQICKRKSLRQIKDAVNAIDPELGGGYEDGIWDRMENRFRKTKRIKKQKQIKMKLL